METPAMPSVQWIGWLPRLRIPRPIPKQADQPGPDHERRQAKRYRCRVKGRLRPVNRPEIAGISVQVHDLSETGVRLVLREYLCPGALVELEIRNHNSGSACERVLRIVHCHSRGPGKWTVGASLATELAPEELHAFRSAEYLEGQRPHIA
jgi:hypothetical protein